MVKLKKSLGQHFLIDEEVIDAIVNQLFNAEISHNLLEIGPGNGALSKKIQHLDFNYKLVEIDDHWSEYLSNELVVDKGRIIHADILKIDFSNLFDDPFSIIGNFPYNISSQIIFKVVEQRMHVQSLIGMFQKEVAERICSLPGSKKYGVPSVLVQTYFNTSYLFDVHAEAFRPPPKVTSGVIQLVRKTHAPYVDYQLLRKIVKVTFGMRRKKMRNSLKGLFKDNIDKVPYLDLRPEQLTWQQFVEITDLLKKINNYEE